MRRGRVGIVGVAIALVVTVAGCGGGEGIRSPQSAPLEFDDGFARLDVPLSTRNVVPAVGGRWVLVYGGWWIDSDGGHTAGDGALYDVERQEWLPAPAGPFEERLWGPAAVWTGREFVVFGTPCADPELADPDNVDFIRCGHDPVAAAFDPATGGWRRVSVPDLRDRDPGHYVFNPMPLGSVAGRAVFEISTPDLSVPNEIVTLDPDGPPGRLAVPPGSMLRCVDHDRLFAFGWGDDSVIPTPAGTVDPTHTWSHVDGRWVEGGGLGPSTTATLREMGGRVTCAPSAVALLSASFAEREGRGGEVDWFSPEAEWHRLPPLDDPRGAFAATVAEVAGTRLVWIGDRIALLRDGVWNRRSAAGYLRRFPSAAYPPPPGSDAAPMIAVLPDLAVSGRYLVGRAYVEDLALVVVDPDRLPPAT